uniref:Mucin-5AC-like isoform X2 n=1 Tax=Petromyzon marinus TaxID=7757 RepID=A0AAJ7UAF1_PETMA|nr:mucin-5AC-like isoform X2 [Petromyzon marinus]
MRISTTAAKATTTASVNGTTTVPPAASTASTRATAGLLTSQTTAVTPNATEGLIVPVTQPPINAAKSTTTVPVHVTTSIVPGFTSSVTTLSSTSLPPSVVSNTPISINTPGWMTTTTPTTTTPTTTTPTTTTTTGVPPTAPPTTSPTATTAITVAPTAPIVPVTTTTATFQHFYIKFTIVNRNYSSDLAQSYSPLRTEYTTNISNLLENLFYQEIGDAMQACTVTNYWEGPLVVVARCEFTNTSSVNESVVDAAFRAGTTQLSSLGPYLLKNTDLTVTRTEPLPPTGTPATTSAVTAPVATTTSASASNVTTSQSITQAPTVPEPSQLIPTTSPPFAPTVGDQQHFYIKFTIVNRNYSSDLAQSYSPLRTEYTTNISNLLENLFYQEIGDALQACTVTNYWEGPLVVVARCEFTNTSSVNESVVDAAFKAGTTQLSSLGPYLLKNTDLTVTRTEPMPPSATQAPPSPATPPSMTPPGTGLPPSVSTTAALTTKQTTTTEAPIVPVTNKPINAGKTTTAPVGLTQGPVQHFYIKFTIVNRNYSSDLAQSYSPLRTEYTTNISNLLENLFYQEIGDALQACTVTNYWEGPLVVVARCEFTNTSSVNESVVDAAFKAGTTQLSSLGPYLLKNTDLTVTRTEPMPPSATQAPPSPATPPSTTPPGTGLPPSVSTTAALTTKQTTTTEAPIVPVTNKPINAGKTTTAPVGLTQGPVQHFYIKFTIVNRNYSSDLAQSYSPLRTEYTTNISNLLENLFFQEIGDALQACTVTNYWEGPLVVVARCEFTNTSSVNESVVDAAFRAGTTQLSSLGPYLLKKTDLTVTRTEPMPPSATQAPPSPATPPSTTPPGTGLPPSAALTTKQTTTTEAPIVPVTNKPINAGKTTTAPVGLTQGPVQHFYIKFTIVNRNYSSDLAQSYSPLRTEYTTNISNLLDNLFAQEIGHGFQTCHVAKYWEGPLVVVARCEFTNTSSVNESVVDAAFRAGTTQLSSLGPYLLKKTDLTVTRTEPMPPSATQAPPSPATPPSTTPPGTGLPPSVSTTAALTTKQTTTTEAPIVPVTNKPINAGKTTTAPVGLTQGPVQHFYIKFTIVNRNYSSDLAQSYSPLRTEYTTNISNLLENLFFQEIGDALQACTVTNYWEGPLVVVARCEFTNTSSVNESVVDAAFRAGTTQLSSLGPYLLKKTDLTVTRTEPMPPSATQAPPSPATPPSTTPPGTGLPPSVSTTAALTTKQTTTTEAPIVPVTNKPINAGKTTTAPVGLTQGPVQHFYIKFTIVNRNYSSDLAQSYSPLRTEYTTNISNLLDNLFAQEIGHGFQTCHVAKYWEGPLVVVARCEFTNTSSVNESVVDAAFRAGTTQLSSLGPYLLKKTDLTVTRTEPMPPSATQAPPSPATPPSTTPPGTGLPPSVSTTAALTTKQTTTTEAPIVPVTNKPINAGKTTTAPVGLTQGPVQHFYIKFTIVNRNYSSDLAQSYSPLRTEYTTNISNLLDNLFAQEIGHGFQTCHVAKYWEGPLVVVARCEFTNTSSVNESVVDAAFKAGTTQLSSLGPYLLNKTDLTVTRTEPLPPTQASTTTGTIVPAATTMKPTVAVGPTQEPLQHFYIKLTIVNRNYSSDLAQNNSTLRQEYTANISGLLEDLFRKQVSNTQHNCTVTNYWPGTLVVVVARCEFTNTSSVNESVVDAAFKAGTTQLSSLGPYLLNKTDLTVTRTEPLPPTQASTTTGTIVPAATTMKPTVAVGPTQEPLQHFYIKLTIVNRNYSSDLAQNNSTLRQEYTANISGLLEDLFRKQVSNTQHNCTVTNYWPGTLVVVVAKCEFTNTSSVNETVVDAAFKNGTQQLTSLGDYLLNTTALSVTRTEPLPPTEAPIAAPETLVAFFIKFTVVNYNYTVDLGNSSSPLYQEHSKNISQELEKLYKNVKGINLKNCTVVDFWDQPLTVVAKCFFVNASDVNNNSVFENFKNGTKSLKKLGNYSLTEKDADVTVTTEQPVRPTVQPVRPTVQPVSPTVQPVLPTEALKDFDIQFTIHNHTFTKELKDNNSSTYKEYVKNITELVENLYRTKYNKTLHYCVITGFTEGSIKVDCKCYFTNSSTVTVADILETFSNKTDGIDLLGAYKLQPNKLTVNGIKPEHEKLKTFYIQFRPFLKKESLEDAVFKKNVTDELEKLFNQELVNITRNCSWVGRTDDYVITEKCDFLDSPDLNETVISDAFIKGTHNITKLGNYQLQNDGTFNVSNKPIVPAEKLKPYYLKFTVTNHKYKTDLETVTSQSYADITKGISAELDKLFNKEIVNKSRGCTIVDYWPADNDGTPKNLVVVAKCNFTDTPEVNRTVVMDAFYKGTNGTYKLGEYDLMHNDIFVDDKPIVPAEKLKPYYLKFTVTNHKYKTDLETVTSQSYADITKGISAELDKLFNKEIVNKSRGCTIVDYWPADNDGTPKNLVVVAKCNFTDTPEVNETVVKDAFYKGTNGTYKLGEYDLMYNDIVVDAHRPSQPEVFKDFNIQFTISNHSFAPDLYNPNSLLYKEYVKNITDRLENLYKTKYNGTFKYCNVTGLRIGSIIVDCHCYFSNSTTSVPDIKNTFANGTGGVVNLGDYQLSPNSLQVYQNNILVSTAAPTTTKPIYPAMKPLPYWIIFIIALCCLLFGAMLLLCLLMLCVKYCRHHTGKYQTMQRPWGTYYPHLDLRKTH